MLNPEREAGRDRGAGGREGRRDRESGGREGGREGDGWREGRGGGHERERRWIISVCV